MESRRLLRVTLTLNVFAAVFLGGACRNHDQHEGETALKYERPDLRQPSFILGAERTRILRDRVTALRLGETSRNAVASVGPPDEDYHFTPAKPPNDWKWHYLTYYVVRVSKTSSNIHDVQIDLIFDRQEKLIAIRSNVDGIPSKGEMEPSK